MFETTQDTPRLESMEKALSLVPRLSRPSRPAGHSKVPLSFPRMPGTRQARSMEPASQALLPSRPLARAMGLLEHTLFQWILGILKAPGMGVPREVEARSRRSHRQAVRRECMSSRTTLATPRALDMAALREVAALYLQFRLPAPHLVHML